MSSKRFSLDGKVALVSGGSRGIGEAIAHGLAEHGARVIVSSRDVAACQLVADAIVAKGGEAVAMRCHAGVASDIEAVFEAIDEKFGRIDILIPARRMGAPEDMVGGVLYLVSDAAAYTSGTTLVIDGAMIS